MVFEGVTFIRFTLWADELCCIASQSSLLCVLCHCFSVCGELSKASVAELCECQ